MSARPVRILAATGCLLATALVAPQAASAHAGGIVSYRFPLPIWLYALGGGLAVLASVPAAVLASPGEDATSRNLYPRIRPLHLGAIGTALASITLAIVLVGGLFGKEEFAANPADVVIWVDLWVGLGVVSTLTANVWDFTSPLSAAARKIDELLDLRGVPTQAYPDGLGMWPAVALLLIWAWLELCWTHGSEPFVVAILIFLYLDFQLVGCAIFSAEVWLPRAELFTAFARTLARTAPTELYVKAPAGKCPAKICRDDDAERIGCVACWRYAPSDERGVRLRWFGAGVHREAPLPRGGGMFVIALLATVVFDGFSRTQRWFDLVDWIIGTFPTAVTSDGTAIATVAMLIIVGSFTLLYLAGCALISLFEHTPAAVTAGRYAPALIPIAGVYFVAHYATYLIVYSQLTWKVLLDPLETDWVPDIGVWTHLPSGVVWWAEVTLIVAGHIIAVFQAQRIARAANTSNRQAALTHSPLTALMIAYTSAGLWVLAQAVKAP